MSGAGAPAATEENWAPIDAPEYRTRVANISEKKAAWGAYIAPWHTSPTVTATTSDRNDPLSTSAKKGNAQAPPPPRRAQQIDRPPPDPVRQGAPRGDDGEVHGRADQDGIQGRLLGQVRLLGRVDQDEGGDDVVADVLRHPCSHGDQDVPPLVPQDGHERHPLGIVPAAPPLLGPGQRGLEHRRLVHGQPNP
ncbi:hypothetical protein GCM10020000_03930 [Streptomyces olivoverticillatus]